MAAAPTPLRIRSGDLTLSVREHSPQGPGRPTVVLVHGYPDQQDVWSTLISRLPLDDWHVVTYDVRGAGSSDAPADLQGYSTDRLVDDLVAVLDEVRADGEAVHLVGHDWGSCQLWDAVAAEADDTRLKGRIASYTSISAPSLDHASWVLRHPRGRRRAVARQGLASWYIGFFRIPVLPDLVWRRGHRVVASAMTRREGLPPGHWGAELQRNAVNGLGLYRANLFQRTSRPRRLRTDLPVLVVQPERDHFVTDVYLQDLDRACSDLRIERVDAGHWAIVTHADEVAELLVAHVRAH
jgi:pimeloyl-ACP methyl ester carboxylesterase